jgi:hypothetical protein
MSDSDLEPPIKLLLSAMPPYMCRRCGREMGGRWGIVNGRWTEIEPGCQPGCCAWHPPLAIK